ncbi:MAG: NAD(P)-dependent oxidoreductase [Candidatus Omnitrophota bacterium]|jgi:nucleoside-diphosphate-sugar epimerase
MKILITGITGFIGSVLSKALIKEGHDVLGVIYLPQEKEILEKSQIRYFLDNNNSRDLMDFFNREAFDGVIHLAACYYLEHTPEQIENLVTSNVLFSTRILDAAVRGGVKWFINTGTFWQNLNNKEYSPVNLYAATKEAFKSIAKYYIDNSEIDFVTLKLFDTYGPTDTRSKVFNIWKRIYQSGESFDMSAGDQFMDIVHVDDVAAAYIKTAELLSKDVSGGLSGEEFVVSTGSPKKLKEIAKIFSEVCGKKLNINWGAKPYRKNEVMKPPELGKRVSGWKPRVSLKEGIAELLADLKD